MIEKIIHFIWIGKNIPPFVQYSIDSFKSNNKDFLINKIFVHDVFESTNIDVQHCLNLILTRNTSAQIDSMLFNFLNKPWHYKDLFNQERFFERYQTNIVRHNTFFSDMLRLYILHKYGGIYVDCDTYNISKFDDALLGKNHFACCTFPKNKEYNISNDFYFCGCKKGHVFDLYDGSNELKTNIVIKESYEDRLTPEFLRLRKKFFECNLDKNEHIHDKKLYIDHYVKSDWQRNSSI